MCYSPWDSKVGHILSAEQEDETKGWAAKGPMANFQDGRNILYLDHNNAYIIIYACQSIKLLTKTMMHFKCKYTSLDRKK